MIFQCQRESIKHLEDLARNYRQSVILSGVSGCGKTYLANLYRSLLGVSDFVQVKPTVNDIKNTIAECYRLQDPIVICIENLDLGVVAASHALLKFLEEPKDGVYIVVTCRNINKIPDTILSRCSQVYVAPPTRSDIDSFANSIDVSKYKKLVKHPISKALRSFGDINKWISISPDYLIYLESLLDDIKSRNICKDTVSSITWSLSHYPDNTEIDPKLLLDCLLTCIDDPYLYKVCIECLDDLNLNRVASHAILSKFVFELKYGG